MPTYDLACGACGHKFEVTHKMSEPHPTKCPKCGKEKVRQAYNDAPAFHNHYSPMHPRVNRGRGH
jgi:putative FmdB family regulatory protein